MLLEDSAAMRGLLVAMAGLALSQLTGNMKYDGGASIIISLILAPTVVLLDRETKGLLIGESASPDVVDGIRSLVEKMPGVDRDNEILTMHVGPDYVLVNISLAMSPQLNRAQAYETPRPYRCTDQIALRPHRACIHRIGNPASARRCRESSRLTGVVSL